MHKHDPDRMVMKVMSKHDPQKMVADLLRRSDLMVQQLTGRHSAESKVKRLELRFKYLKKTENAIIR